AERQENRAGARSRRTTLHDTNRSRSRLRAGGCRQRSGSCLPSSTARRFRRESCNCLPTPEQSAQGGSAVRLYTSRDVRECVSEAPEWRTSPTSFREYVARPVPFLGIARSFLRLFRRTRKARKSSIVRLPSRLSALRRYPGNSECLPGGS